MIQSLPEGLGGFVAAFFHDGLNLFRLEPSVVAPPLHASVSAVNGRAVVLMPLDDQQAPFGGFKHSGVGREFGTFGIEAFLEPRAILDGCLNEST